jgi:DNA-dependent metalloprotease WSS1
MSQTFVQSITHLKDKPRADTALEILQKVVSLVKPIMRKHGWRLPVLSEFFPDNPNLLGK